MAGGNLPWPNNRPFPESVRDSQGDGSSDFPGSSGDREKGKFRPSKQPKLTQVAVINDDGSPIGWALIPQIDELIYWMKALYAGLVLGESAEDITDGDIFDSL